MEYSVPSFFNVFYILYDYHIAIREIINHSITFDINERHFVVYS